MLVVTCVVNVSPILSNITLADEKKAPSLAAQLYASYKNIKTISCRIRKTTTFENKTERLLSRVYYKHPSLLHVDNIAPRNRRIIADGKSLYYHVHGHSKGFSTNLKNLKGSMLALFQNIPGTPVEHLIKIKNLPETQIPPSEKFPLRRGYQADKFFVLLSCDEHNRLGQIDFFKTAEMKIIGARYSYSSFLKVNNSTWIPKVHKAVMFLPDGKNITETRRIDNLTVDKPIAVTMFNPNTFFNGVIFVDKFEDAKE